MTVEELQGRVSKALAEASGAELERDEILLRPFDGLGINSLDKLELLLDMENQLDLDPVPDAEAIKIKCGRDLVDYLKPLVAKPNGSAA